MLELYHWEPNGDSLKMIIALKEKGLPYRGRYVDLLDLEHHGEAFKAAAEGGRVPLLVADGVAMKDSQFALQYLAEAYEPRLAPADPAGWYDIQDWTGFAGGLGANVRILGWHTVTSPAMSDAERKAFLDRAAGAPGRWLVLDATAPADALAAAIRSRVAGLLGGLR